ncbi:hypothetical protein HDU91_005994, partial [Kappamyces sp. JEL0680]
MVGNLIPVIRKAAKIPETRTILLYEEVKPGMIDLVSLDNTFVGAELLDGDILVFQEELLPEETNSMADPTLANAPGYFEQLANRVEVPFKNRMAKDPEGGEELRLILSKKMTYEEVCVALSKQVKYDHAKIKLYSTKGNGQPSNPFFSRQTLQEMLNSSQYAVHYNNNLIYYELLDMSLEELEKMRY